MVTPAPYEHRSKNSDTRPISMLQICVILSQQTLNAIGSKPHGAKGSHQKNFMEVGANEVGMQQP